MTTVFIAMKSDFVYDEFALHGDEDGRRIDEDRRHGDEVSGPSKIATIF